MKSHFLDAKVRPAYVALGKVNIAKKSITALFKSSPADL